MQARAARMQARARLQQAHSTAATAATRRRVAAAPEAWQRRRRRPSSPPSRAAAADDAAGADAAAAAALNPPAPPPQEAAAGTPAAAPAAAAAPASPPSRLPARVLAVDYGNVFTGLAIGPGPGAGASAGRARAGAAPSASAPAPAAPAASMLGSPRPLRVVRSQGRAVGLLARDVVAEARLQGAAAVLVGVPLSRGQRLGDPAADSPQAARCREFAHNAALAGGGAVDVYIYDESGTTADALRRLRVPMAQRHALTRRDKLERSVDGWSAAALLSAFCSRPRRALRVRAALGVDRGEDTEEEAGDREEEQQE